MKNTRNANFNNKNLDNVKFGKIFYYRAVGERLTAEYCGNEAPSNSVD